NAGSDRSGEFHHRAVSFGSGQDPFEQPFLFLGFLLWRKLRNGRRLFLLSIMEKGGEKANAFLRLFLFLYYCVSFTASTARSGRLVMMPFAPAAINARIISGSSIVQ